MHALRKIHKAVEPGGILLDLHPIPPNAVAEAGGERLGRVDEREFFATVRETEAGLEELVRAGLFARERQLRFDVLERFESGDEALEEVTGWRGCRMPKRLAARIAAAPPPVDMRERVVLARFRVL